MTGRVWFPIFVALVFSSHSISTSSDPVNEADAAAFGRLDEFREVIEVSEPGSTRPEDSFEVPGDQDMELSPRERRLMEVGGSVLTEVKNSTGHFLLITARSLGKLDKAVLSESAEEVLQRVNRILESNEALTGEARNYDLRLVDVQEFELIGYRVLLRQYVHNIPVDKMSYLDATDRGDVYQLALYIANPENVLFNPQGWMNTRDLDQLARSAWTQRYPEYLPEGELNGKMSIYYLLESGQFVPAYEVLVGSRRAVINAIDGNVIKVTSNKVS